MPNPDLGQNGAPQPETRRWQKFEREHLLGHPEYDDTVGAEDEPTGRPPHRGQSE